MDLENRMTKIETKLVTIEDKIDKVPTVAEMDLANEKLIKRMLECTDKRYASKLTEKIVYGVVSLIITAVATSIIYLIIK